MSDCEFEVGQLVEVYFGSDVWIRGIVMKADDKCVVRFPNGIVDTPMRKTVRPVPPLVMLAEAAE